MTLRLCAAVVGAVALVGAASALACSGRGRSAPTAGFWYESSAFALPGNAKTRFDGPLEHEEMESIKQLSRAEVEQAFAGLRITVTASHDAFWRVEVLRSLPVIRNKQLPRAGESMALGALGGAGSVDFDIVAFNAIHYAPVGASRQRIIEGIGRGIGRVAVHEFMHQMLGVAAQHNDADKNSYECGSPERAAQYYGDLRWTTAWPLLHQKFGT